MYPTNLFHSSWSGWTHWSDYSSKGTPSGWCRSEWDEQGWQLKSTKWYIHLRMGLAALDEVEGRANEVPGRAFGAIISIIIYLFTISTRFWKIQRWVWSVNVWRHCWIAISTHLCIDNLFSQSNIIVLQFIHIEFISKAREFECPSSLIIDQRSWFIFSFAYFPYVSIV